MAAGESGEEEASRRGNEPDFDSIFGRGIEATDCNYMPTFYRFWDITTLLLENLRFFAILSTPVSFEAVARGFLWDVSYESCCQRSRVRGLPEVESAWSYGH